MRACPFTLDITEVVCGMAPGVDMLGLAWARRNQIPWREFPAQWRTKDGELDRGAGYRRNEAMAVYADALVAIWDGESGGTRDMIERAKRHGLRVFVYHPIYGAQAT